LGHLANTGLDKPEPDPQRIAHVENHVLAVRDLIESVENYRPPLCDVYAAAVTVEMISAVFASHWRNSASVGVPLKERGSVSGE
jgi:hypothetical protein